MKKKEFILREDQLKKIKDEAESKGMFQNEWMRDLVDVYFDSLLLLESILVDLVEGREFKTKSDLLKDTEDAILSALNLLKAFKP